MAGSDAYVAFLRGVNVSGRNLLKMNELKAQLSMSGIEGVQTYLQSGNILFKADRGICKSHYSEKISDLIREMGLTFM